MIRWLDFNDTWLAAEWGHPSDNLGGILSTADWLSRTALAQGKAPLGFLNPWLYSNVAMLTDITTGASRGCTNRQFFSAPAYWNCTKGWDPVTGLGTPNFPLMLEAAAPGTPNA